MTEKLIKKIADHYGKEHQLLKLAEESAELAAAAIRLASSNGESHKDEFESELADVLIMITQMIHLMDNEESVGDKVDFKVARQLERMEVEK